MRTCAIIHPLHLELETAMHFTNVVSNSGEVTNKGSILFFRVRFRSAVPSCLRACPHICSILPWFYRSTL